MRVDSEFPKDLGETNTSKTVPINSLYLEHLVQGTVSHLDKCRRNRNLVVLRLKRQKQICFLKLIDVYMAIVKRNFL